MTQKQCIIDFYASIFLFVVIHSYLHFWHIHLYITHKMIIVACAGYVGMVELEVLSEEETVACKHDSDSTL